MHDELRRSTRVLSAKADIFLCRAFHNLKLDLVSLRKQSCIGNAVMTENVLQRPRKLDGRFRRKRFVCL